MLCIYRYNLRSNKVILVLKSCVQFTFLSNDTLKYLMVLVLLALRLILRYINFMNSFGISLFTINNIILLF